MINFKYIFLFFITLLLTVSVFQSCGDDTPTTNNGGTQQTGITGDWRVESAQIVQAPPGSGPSEVMKQALVPFGMMSASNVGYCNVNFGDSTWNLTGSITNTVIKLICGANDSVYTANGLYTTNSNAIAFVVLDYSGPHGSQTTGAGTYSLTSKLTIDLNLANNEKWKINLIR